MRKLYTTLAMTCLSLGWMFNLQAQSLEFQLDGQLGCQTKTYCVTLQVRVDTGANNVKIGTSSIWLDYNAEALAFQGYAPTQFFDGVVCNANLTNWAPQQYDAVSMPGAFHLSMHQLSASRSCPKITKNAWQDIGVICFDIVKQGANPDISVDLAQTFFNRSRPNDGSNPVAVSLSDSICQAGVLACDCPGPSLPCNDYNVYTVNDRFDEYCDCNGELLDSDQDGIYDGVDPCLDLVYEAEDATFTGGPVVQSSYPQFSGLGYVDFIYSSTQDIQFEVTAQQPGSFQFAVGYALDGTTPRPLEVWIDSVVVISSLDFPPTGGWNVWDTVSFSHNLTAGVHHILFKTLTNPGAGNLDYLLLSSCTSCTQSGQSCDDLDPCTTGDVYDAHCNCAGVQQDSDQDGVCDVNDICPNGNDLADADNDQIPDACDSCDDQLLGMACDDGQPCTINDVYDASCNCAGTFTGMDTDNDGICDAYDICVGGDDLADADGDGIPTFCDTCDNRTIGKPCDDGNPCTILDRVQAGCECVGILMDDDVDGSCNWDDQCPNFDNTLIGTSCDDGDPQTINDVYTSYCTCAGEAPTPCIATGELRYEIWKNITGTRINDLTSAAAYPSNPDSIVVLDEYVEGLTNYGDYYGSRISGLLCPPLTGYYTFMIASDDRSQLWLSTDENRENMLPIAYHNGYTNPYQWDKYVTQNSDSIAGQLYLIKGKSYFFQALQKENTVGDHLAIRWIRPDGMDEAPMPASYFSLPPTQVAITHTDISCFGLTDGDMKAIPSHGTPPYSFSWSEGSTTQTLTGLQAGTYTVMITDASGNTASQMATIDEPTALTVSTTQTNISCHSGSDGSIELTAIGGTLPHRVRWNRGQGNAFSIDSLTAGNYYATVTDANGCVTTKSTSLNQPSAISLEADIYPSTHLDGQVYLSAQGGTSPYAYAWSDGSTHARKFGMATGIYPVTITDANGCIYTESIELGSPPKMENEIIRNLSDSWQTISLSQAYSSPVIVATVRMDSANMPPAITRIRNAGSNSFEIRIQGPNGHTYHAYDVDYWVVEEGVYTAANGMVMEAVKAQSIQTAHKVNWGMESRTLQNVYAQLAVVGQVMTENDTSWSVFWASKYSNRSQAPTGTNFAAGKHVGEDTDTTRLAETIGYIAIEAGSYRIGGKMLEAGVGADMILGVRSEPSGVSYPIGLSKAESAVISSAALDNTDGGWPVLMGENPVTGNSLQLAIDEALLTDRYHGTEQVAYVAFASDCPVAVGAFPPMEQGDISQVTETWQTISLCHSYTSPIIVATPILLDNTVNAVVTRIRNAGGNSFELKVQHPGGATNLNYTVQYWVVEEGTYTEAENGITMEAQQVNSSLVADKYNWVMEPQIYQNVYQQPVVMGQVMSENDSRWSVFWASSHTGRTTPPQASGFAAGLHVGEDLTTTRSSEVIGIIVVEAGTYANNSNTFEAGLGADIVQGLQNSATGYPYPLGITGAYRATVSAAAIDGADGGFPALFGPTPIDGSQLTLTFQEDRLKDSERSHTTEQLAYVAFGTGLASGNRQPQYAVESDDVDEEHMLQTRFTLFPNPTYGNLQLEWWHIGNDQAQLMVYDMMGKVVQQMELQDLQVGNQRQQLNLQSLSDGTYLVELKGEAYLLSKKVVLVKQ